MPRYTSCNTSSGSYPHRAIRNPNPAYSNFRTSTPRRDRSIPTGAVDGATGAADGATGAGDSNSASPDRSPSDTDHARRYAAADGTAPPCRPPCNARHASPHDG